MAALGIEAEPMLYADDAVDQVRAQLFACDGVLVWVDPLSAGRNRTVLDAMLRDVATQGVWVSAHPDVILKMGVKEVLHRTRASRLGNRHASLSHRRGIPRGIPAAAANGRPACPQTKSRQRWPGRVEGRAILRLPRRCAEGSRTGGAPRQHAGGHGARGFHERGAKRISRTKDASSISRSSRGCRTE